MYHWPLWAGLMNKILLETLGISLILFTDTYHVYDMHCSPHMHLIFGFTIVIVWCFPFILSPSYHLDSMEPVKLYEVWESLSGHLSFPDSYFYWWVVPWPSFEELLMFDNFTLKEIRTDLFQPRLANTFTVTPILTVPFSSVMLLPWLWPTFANNA